MPIRYNFKLVEREYVIDLSVLPVPCRFYSDRDMLVYGIDATRFSGFENLESPMSGLKFLNRLWNLPFDDFQLDDVFLKRIEYYMTHKRYHNVIALIRGIMKHEKKVSSQMLDILFPFIPYITSKLKENRKDV